MQYPGGKNGGGAWQRIINLIPPHTRYCECFAGSAPVLRYKRPARQSWAVDLDPAALAGIRGVVPAGTAVVKQDAVWWIRSRLVRGWWQPGDFLYCDPPYLMETRRSGPMYRFEMTREEHEELLDVLLRLPCMVLISGYWSDLYADRPMGWSTASFLMMTRGGRQAEEWLWFNYPPPVALHDYRWLGSTFREREKLNRRRRRWVARLARMDTLQRQMLLAAMQEVDPAAAPPGSP
jgi:DNA adenine methylase